MNVHRYQLEGVYLLENSSSFDKRGSFSKLFSEMIFTKSSLNTSWKELLVTKSKKNTIRGMHFQIPPYDQIKMICLIEGEISDIILDIRQGSPTYGKYIEINISNSDQKSIYISKGFAHGFAARSDNAVLLYLLSENYNRESDKGIRYDSFGYDWRISNPIISERDSKLPSFEEFKSPFKYEKTEGRNKNE